MERRGEPRFYVGAKARLFLPDNPQREIPAHVINVSASGLRVMIGENLSVGHRIVVDLPHHVVAAEVCNRDAAGEKFAVGVRRLHEVSKLDSSRSAGEQVVGLMILMGWLATPEPAGVESRNAAEAITIELPLDVEAVAVAIEAPQATQPEPAAIELGEVVGLAAVAMELPKAAEPKPAVIEWQVVQSAAPAIEFPKAPEPEPAAIDVREAVQSAAPAIEFAKAPEPEIAAIEVTAESLTASEPAPPPFAPPPLPTHTEPVHAVEAGPVKKGLPTWVAVGAGMALALVVVAILARTNPDARASVPAKPMEAPPAPATPANSTATPPSSPAPQSNSPAPQPRAPTALAQPAISNVHTVRVAAREASWVTISADGRMVFEKMLNPGQTKEVEFSQFSYVHIGNSAKIDVTLDSRPIAPFAQGGHLRLLELTDAGARDLPWRNGDPGLASRPRGGSAPQ